MRVRGPKNAGRAQPRPQGSLLPCAGKIGIPIPVADQNDRDLWIDFCTTLRGSRNKRNVGSCWLKSLTSFKLRETTPNNTQQHENRVCKRTQQVILNNVGSCRQLHGRRLFAQIYHCDVDENVTLKYNLAPYRKSFSIIYELRI